jgi:hypothetical protein
MRPFFLCVTLTRLGAMNESVAAAPYRVAVIGRNLPAALWLLAARRLAPEVTFSWIRTEQERAHREVGDNFWSLIPESLYKEFREHVPAVRAPEPDVFLQRARRLRLSEFRAHGDARGTVAVPPPVREKLAAISLWSDLSPPLWGAAGLRAREPDVQWIARPPTSLAERGEENFYLVPHRSTLEHLARILAEQGVQVADDDLGAVGVEAGRRQDPHRIIHNAPRGLSEAQAILWTSVQGPLKAEGSQVARTTGWHASATPRGRWVSRGAWVPAEAITALSPFSLWLARGARERFFETGRLESRALRRVFCLESPVAAGAAGQAWLQIDELELDFPWHPLAPASEEELLRVDPPEFLFEACPALARLETHFRATVLDENHLFEDARPLTDRVANNIESWFNGTLGSPASYFENWKQRHLRRRPRPDKTAAP